VSAKILINYRRTGDVSRHLAGRIYDRLCRDLGKDCVFIDVDKIPLGYDFAEVIEAQLEQCDYVLALIGPAWLDLPNEHGQRRLDDPEDWVRVELATALGRGIPVVPILVEGGKRPEAEHLPQDLIALAGRQALELTDAGFHHEIDRLVSEIKSYRAEMFSFDAWSSWGDLRLRRNDSSPNMLVMNVETKGAAGVVIEGKLPYGGRKLTLEVSGSQRSVFQNEKMFKLEANQCALAPTRRDQVADSDRGFVRSQDGQIEFDLPSEIHKLELVFWCCTLRDLMIIGRL
jgi:TIR domain